MRLDGPVRALLTPHRQPTRQAISSRAAAATGREAADRLVLGARPFLAPELRAAETQARALGLTVRQATEPSVATREARDLMASRALLPDLDIDRLARMPEDTLGGAYGRFMQATGYTHDVFAPLDRYRFPASTVPAEGVDLIRGNSDLDWVRRWTRQTHDFGHLVSEYSMMARGFAIPAASDAAAGRHLLQHRQTHLEEMAFRTFWMGQTHHPVSATTVAGWIRDVPRYFDRIEGLRAHQDMSFEVLEELAHRAIADGTLESTRPLHARMKQIVRDAVPARVDRLPADQRRFIEQMVDAYERGLDARSTLTLRWDRLLERPLDGLKSDLGLAPRRVVPPTAHMSFSRPPLQEAVLTPNAKAGSRP
ncbi:MAG: hypothetical protein VKP72_09085 [bacterium]|nr:hypothetical protein [bacterium]